MKINDFMNLSELYVKVDNKVLNEGDLVEGEILDIFDDLVIIDIKGLGIIKAHAQKDLSGQKGENLTFIVKTSLPNKIELKAIFTDINTDIKEKENLEKISKAEDYLTNILKEFGIKDDPISIEFLDNLMKYNVKINKENITTGIKVLDKLEQIINLDDEEIVILANPIEEDFNIGQVGQEDIRNFIITNKDEINNKVDLAPAIKENLSQFIGKKSDDSIIAGESLNETLNNKLDIDIIKIISFFVKFNIKPTINNIKYFQKIREDSNLLSEDFKILEEIIDKKFTNFNKKAIINNGSPKNIIEESIIKQKEVLDKVIDYIKEDSSIDNKEFKKSIEELRDKIEFLKEMNKELTFIYLPLNLECDNDNSVIKFFKKKKREKDFDSKTNIFINLRTKRLGNIKIYCEVLNKSMNIKFGDVDKEDLNLFKSNEDKLKNLIEFAGYKINSIEYSLDKNMDILNSLVVNRKPIYNLDVQV